MVLLCLHDRSQSGNFNFILLAGMTAGLAAWTKNEGILFLAAIIAARFVTVARPRGLRAYLRELRHFVIGLAPPLAVLIYFKVALAPPNDLLHLRPVAHPHARAV